MKRQPAVYILASRRNGTLYTGVSSDLRKRVWQHKQGLVDGFTKRYKVKTLVWYELHKTMKTAIQREKAIKEWQRAWKKELIESFNPKWEDLYKAIGGFQVSRASKQPVLEKSGSRLPPG